jgi:hypothetical protein
MKAKNKTRIAAAAIKLMKGQEITLRWIVKEITHTKKN